MKHKLSIQKRLILPVVLLGIVALISNILSIFSIHNVNANAANIVDNYMVGEAMLAGIHQSVMNIHKLALSHIVATDYSTMIKGMSPVLPRPLSAISTICTNPLPPAQPMPGRGLWPFTSPPSSSAPSPL